MTLKIYNKLVRDKIPELLESKDLQFTMKTFNYLQYLTALQNKLIEECNETVTALVMNASFPQLAESRADVIEELADILEVMWAITDEIGATPEDVEAARLAKLESRGGYTKQVKLIMVDE